MLTTMIQQLTVSVFIAIATSAIEIAINVSIAKALVGVSTCVTVERAKVSGTFDEFSIDD